MITKLRSLEDSVVVHYQNLQEYVLNILYGFENTPTTQLNMSLLHDINSDICNSLFVTDPFHNRIYIHW